MVAWTTVAGVIGTAAYAWARSSAQAGVLRPESGAWFVAVLAGAIAIALVAQYYKVPTAIVFDVAAPAAALGFAAEVFAHLLISGTTTWLFRVGVIEAVAGLLIFCFLWSEGKAAMEWQRPNGLVAGEFLILSGGVQLLTEWLRGPRTFSIAGPYSIAALATIATGGVVAALVLTHYFRVTEEHRILDHIDRWGDALQPEYTPPTPECPTPQRWRMYDSMSAEVETLQFLKCLMTTMKPNLVVETGSFAGMSTVAMAEGIQENGFGRIVTCELDERVFKKAKDRIDNSGLRKWVEYRNESSLDIVVEGTIDILFSDSEQSIREQEVRKFLPQMNPNGLILIHDAASCYKIVREGAMRMESEGLISVVLMPTPRGLVIAQKREGRR